MRDAETVTFGGSGLDRAAAIRRDVPALAAHAQDPASRCIVVWRGKILVAGDESRGVVRLPMDHPMLAQTSGPQIFLGFEGGRCSRATCRAGSLARRRRRSRGLPTRANSITRPARRANALPSRAPC